MKLTRLILTTLLAACPAFSQTVIMGHHIGETVPQFLAAEPALASRIDSCRAGEPKPLTPEDIHALSKQDAYALGQQVFTKNQLSPDSNFPMKRPPNRDQLEDLARKGLVMTIDKRMPDEVATCHGLLALTAPTSSSPVIIRSLPNIRPRPVTWHFKTGALFQIDIDFHGGDFSEIASDLTQKIRVQPNEKQENDTPNLYGALLHVYRKSIWLTPELYALLEDDEGSADRQIHVSVLRRAEYDDWAKTHLKKGSLD